MSLNLFSICIKKIDDLNNKDSQKYVDKATTNKSESYATWSIRFFNQILKRMILCALWNMILWSIWWFTRINKLFEEFSVYLIFNAAECLLSLLILITCFTKHQQINQIVNHSFHPNDF